MKVENFQLPEKGVIYIGWKEDGIKTGYIEFVDRRIVDAKVEDITGKIEKEAIDAALDILSRIHDNKVSYIELYDTIDAEEPIEGRTEINGREWGVIELMKNFRGKYYLDGVDVCDKENLREITNAKTLTYSGKDYCEAEDLERVVSVLEIFEFKKNFEVKMKTPHRSKSLLYTLPPSTSTPKSSLEQYTSTPHLFIAQYSSSAVFSK